MKTLTQLTEEYNDWCGKNDMDSFLKRLGFGDKRMLSADELLHELMEDLDTVVVRRKVLVSQIAWVKQFCLEWETAVRETRNAHKPHAVYAKSQAHGWTNVHVFKNFEEAVDYVDGQVMNPSVKYEVHQIYHKDDMDFVISPIQEG